MSVDPRLRVIGPHVYGLREDSNIGGEVYERQLLERLPDHGIALRLGLPRDHAVSAPPRDWELDVLRYRVGMHWTRAPLTLAPYVARLLRADRVDVLRGHSVRHTGPALLLGRALAHSRVPIVLHHHHLYPRWARLEAAIAARADAVITVSEHSRMALIAAGVGAERVHVVREGASRPPRTDGWPAAWQGEGLRLLYLGRLEERKRPELTITAVARALADGVESSLVIAGEGPLAGELAREARSSGVAARVRFTGRVSEHDKWRLYDSAELLLFPSTLEGFGLVVAEAQSRGVPVIAAAGSATAEAFEPGRSGLSVPAVADAFAQAISELADAPRRGAMSARAEEFARRFDWDACAAGVAAIYHALSGDSRTRSA